MLDNDKYNKDGAKTDCNVQNNKFSIKRNNKIKSVPVREGEKQIIQFVS